MWFGAVSYTHLDVYKRQAIAFVGCRNEEKDCCYAHHNGKFAIDEDGIEVGTALYAQYAIDFLNKYEK